MTLGEYVTRLVGGEAIIPTAKAIGISHGSLHRIMSGSTDQPQIETLKAIALHYGKTEQEQQDIYLTLMGLANYLSPQPRSSLDEAYDLARAEAAKKRQREQNGEQV